ncbi:hypothetical protein A1Q2_07900 [Trichosporon asahii var. asahii CBS 8904]|uniref:CAP-Gly domain-containing protein n=1 Tax=Trichosporon asahii var. asahii (strain CBS 8904) TaxID=1220162 RepID=K1VM44_TRIAC|nr:hypothetical protein A1Q2_07900 [Trichosporon asahii var. asahii CBS 8904]
MTTPAPEIPLGARVAVQAGSGYTPLIADPSDTPTGKNNGSVQGEVYFECRANYGVFVRPSQVKVINPNPPKTRPGTLAKAGSGSSASRMSSGTASRSSTPGSKPAASTPTRATPTRTAPRQSVIAPTPPRTGSAASASSTTGAAKRTVAAGGIARPRASISGPSIRPPGAAGAASRRQSTIGAAGSGLAAPTAGDRSRRTSVSDPTRRQSVASTTPSSGAATPASGLAQPSPRNPALGLPSPQPRAQNLSPRPPSARSASSIPSPVHKGSTSLPAPIAHRPPIARQNSSEAMPPPPLPAQVAPVPVHADGGPPSLSHLTAPLPIVQSPAQSPTVEEYDLASPPPEPEPSPPAPRSIPASPNATTSPLLSPRQARKLSVRSSSPDREAAAAVFAQKRELEELRIKVRLLETRRHEDQERINHLEKVSNDADQLHAIRAKLQSKFTRADLKLTTAKFQEQQQALGNAQRQARDLQSENAHMETKVAEFVDQLEMATLDREVAEEKAEAAEAEVSRLNEKVQELELEVAVLKEENAEYERPIEGLEGERTSLAFVQPENHNQRLKEALIRLRDLSQDTEREHKTKITELEKELGAQQDVSAQLELAEAKLANSEAQVEDLKQQLDDALGAEDLLEELTERNLQIAVARATDGAAVDTHVSAVRRLEAADERQRGRLARPIGSDEGEELPSFNAEGYLAHRDELSLGAILLPVPTLVEDLGQVLHDERVAAPGANAGCLGGHIGRHARRRNPLDGLGAGVVPEPRTPAVDPHEQEEGKHTLRRHVHQRGAVELHVAVGDVGPMSAPIAEEAEEVEADHDGSHDTRVGREPRRAQVSEVQVLVCLVALVGAEDDFFFGMCPSCSEPAEAFSVISPRSTCSISFWTLTAVARSLSSFRDALPFFFLPAPEVPKLIGFEDPAPGVSNAEWKSDMVPHALITADLFLGSRHPAILNLIGESTLEEALYEPVQSILNQVRAVKAPAGKLVAIVEDIVANKSSLVTEFTAALGDQVVSVSNAVDIAVQLAQRIGAHVTATRSSKEPLKLADIEKFCATVVAENVGASDLSPWEVIGSFVTRLGTDLGDMLPKFRNAAKAGQTISLDVEAPWLARVQAIKEAASHNAEAERKLSRLQEDLKDTLREVKLREQSLEESGIKIETLERRLEASKRQSDQIAELEEDLQKARKQEKMYEEALEQLQTEQDHLEAENARLRKHGVPEKDGEKGETVKAVEARGMIEQIEALRSAIRFLRNENSLLKSKDLYEDVRMLPPLRSLPDVPAVPELVEDGGSDVESEGPVTPKPRTPKTPKSPLVKNANTRQALDTETKLLYRELAKFSAAPRIVDLSGFDGKGPAWRSRKNSPEAQAWRWTMERVGLEKKVEDLAGRVKALRRQ